MFYLIFYVYVSKFNIIYAIPIIFRLFVLIVTSSVYYTGLYPKLRYPLLSIEFCFGIFHVENILQTTQKSTKRVSTTVLHWWNKNKTWFNYNIIVTKGHVWYANSVQKRNGLSYGGRPTFHFRPLLCLQNLNTHALYSSVRPCTLLEASIKSLSHPSSSSSS